MTPVCLFRSGNFTLHSGLETFWKIDCDGLTWADWYTLARMAALEFLPAFGEVEGVPRGGIPFANALEQYGVRGGPLLIADDVCTTGASLEKQRAGRAALGVVVFARGRVPSWVTPLFQMPN